MTGVVRPMFGFNAVTDAPLNNPDKIGFAAEANGKTYRLPVALYAAFAAIADPEPAQLTTTQIDQLRSLDIELVDATASVQQRDAYAMLAKGIDRETINATIAAHPTVYLPAKPVKLLTAFRRV